MCRLCVSVCVCAREHFLFCFCFCYCFFFFFFLHFFTLFSKILFFFFWGKLLSHVVFLSKIFLIFLLPFGFFFLLFRLELLCYCAAKFFDFK